jgi:hypothetical protein
MNANSILEIELDVAIARDLSTVLSDKRGIEFKLNLKNELVICRYTHNSLNDAEREVIYATIQLNDATVSVLKAMLDSSRGFGTMLHLHDGILSLAVVLVEHARHRYTNIAKTREELNLQVF